MWVLIPRPWNRDLSEGRCSTTWSPRAPLFPLYKCAVTRPCFFVRTLISGEHWMFSPLWCADCGSQIPTRDSGSARDSVVTVVTLRGSFSLTQLTRHAHTRTHAHTHVSAHAYTHTPNWVSPKDGRGATRCLEMNESFIHSFIHSWMSHKRNQCFLTGTFSRRPDRIQRTEASAGVYSSQKLKRKDGLSHFLRPALRSRMWALSTEAAGVQAEQRLDMVPLVAAGQQCSGSVECELGSGCRSQGPRSRRGRGDGWPGS